VSRILDQGPHTVVVYPEETVTDSYGNTIKRPSAVGVLVTGCLVAPVSASRQADGGFATWVKLPARDAPLGPWSRVEHDGKSYVVESGPNFHDASPTTRHVSATLQLES
jgi:hypothetical protein